MADLDVNGDPVTEDVSDKSQKKTAKHDSGVADLERVTDYAEEKEISSQDISGALSLYGDRQNKDAAARLARERELQKIAIKKEDVDLMVNEMEITRTLAERTLREHGGNVVDALVSLTN
ncbi:huntingtin-interacting protein K-like [Ctenocephalides felis]|uniref:huntingtin-interacting protein K-like n=1 Tax=Ctenocephalides felis TaxID=7515 RepID=UPI000E6E488E|nr:huntingtin-interacting protein K-like [Ctenocephalides felis]XP_026467155.1 huntingtin-interacting protein K-like [Ctenocephalides felis]